MSLLRVLLSIARAVVEQVAASILQQQNVVNEQVKSVINNHVQQVMNGVWIGKGADAFVNSIQQEALPVVEQVLEIGHRDDYQHPHRRRSDRPG